MSVRPCASTSPIPHGCRRAILLRGFWRSFAPTCCISRPGAWPRDCCAGQGGICGPFMRNGEHTAASNAEFDTSLRHANPDWGVRDVEDLRTAAAGLGLTLAEIVQMPANNLILIFERRR